jgi:hypothetical protein
MIEVCFISIVRLGSKIGDRNYTKRFFYSYFFIFPLLTKGFNWKLLSVYSLSENILRCCGKLTIIEKD